MNPFFLGLRLLAGSGRRARARFLLMTAGLSLGVACLAAGLSIPAILHAQDTRAAARDPQPRTEAAEIRPTDIVAHAPPQEGYGAKLLRRVFIAAPAAGNPAVPPGIDRLPSPGQLFASPQLRKELVRTPALSRFFPGRVVGTIAPAGLTSRDELFAYIGRTREQLPLGFPVSGFGGARAPYTTIDAESVTTLRFTLACVVLLPLVIFLSVCARLSGESRARRLAALRLVGLSARDTMRVNAGESVVAAFVGAVIGVGVYVGVNEVVARVGLPGLHWYPADGRPGWETVAWCLVGCPALAWVVGQFSARRAAKSPIGVRRTGERRAPRKAGALLLVPGLGVIGGYCVLSVMGRDPSGGSASSLLVPGAVLLTGAGLVWGLAPVTAWLAERVAGSAKSLPLALAMRRTEVDPGASLRVVTGLVLLLFGASLTQGVLVELDQVSRRTDPLQEYRIELDQIDAAQREALERVPGVVDHVVSYRSWDPLDGSDVPQTSMVVATCAQLTAITRRASGCVDGKVMQLRDADSAFAYDPKPGERYAFALESGRKAMFTVPRERVEVRPWSVSVVASGALLVPPSLLPAHVAEAGGALTLVSGADPATVRKVLDGIGAVAPTAAVEPVGIVVESLAQLTVIRSLLAVGMVLGLVIGVAAFVVSVADRAMERRGQVAALALLGARAGTLRVVQVVQVVLPLAVGLGAALVTGWLAESSYLITGGGAVHWDWDALPLLFGCALGVLLIAGVASVPMVRRHVDPEHIRRD